MFVCGEEGNGFGIWIQDWDWSGKGQWGHPTLNTPLIIASSSVHGPNTALITLLNECPSHLSHLYLSTLS